MRYLSVCSGIEAATVAWEPLGWEPVAFAEIDAFPSAVLEHHYPDVCNLGDMTQAPADEIAADILVGGTPCQAFSVAGARQSLADTRGNLALSFVELADELEPAYVVWENVPGVLSVGDNAFGCFLGALSGSGCELQPTGERWTDSGLVLGPKRTVAWRCLDAQYFGLAQRRKRVFALSCPRGGPDPAEILFEREGMRRDSPPEQGAEQGAADDVAKCLRGSGCPSHREDFDTYVAEVAPGLTASGPPFSRTGNARIEAEAMVVCAWTASSRSNSFAWERPYHGALNGQLTNDDSNLQMGVRIGLEVRRLTPVECERLQGFPDGYTQIPWMGKPKEDCPDGPRYKALGNSMAVPVMRWIGGRINASANR